MANIKKKSATNDSSVRGSLQMLAVLSLKRDHEVTILNLILTVKNLKSHRWILFLCRLLS